MAIVRTGYANFAAFPPTGAVDIIYVDLSNGNEYTWVTSAYVAYTPTLVGVSLGDKSAAWFTANPTLLLAKGQIVFLDDQSGQYKKGDGVTALSALSFLGGSSTTPTLQEVTDEGASTTNLIEVGGLDNTAKIVTLNKGGASSTGSGIEIEESGSILGYIKTAVGSAFDFLHPLNANYARIALNLLTGNRTYNLPDSSGTFALMSTWNDISSTSTVTGWSSFVIKEIFELVEGNKITVFFFIQGTSNSTTTEFTVTNSANASIDAFYASGLGVNGGTGLTNACRCAINASSSVVYFTTNWTGTNFSATGTKSVRGTLIYYK